MRFMSLATFAAISLLSFYSHSHGEEIAGKPYNKIKICAQDADEFAPKVNRFLTRVFGNKYNVVSANAIESDTADQFTLIYFGTASSLDRPRCLTEAPGLSTLVARLSADYEGRGGVLPLLEGGVVAHQLCGLAVAPSGDGHANFVASVQFKATACTTSNILSIFGLDAQYCDRNNCDLK